jgi:tetratricopeptide (TPR) repeat protein
MATDDHTDLIDRGVALHEARCYRDALPLLEAAHILAPDCPDAIYNRANTLFMLNREQEAYDLFIDLVGRSDRVLRDGCPTVRRSAVSLKTDAYFMIFMALLYGTEDWDDAYPYAQEHLRRRRRGVASVFTRRHVLREIDNMRRQFGPHT